MQSGEKRNKAGSKKLETRKQSTVSKLSGAGVSPNRQSSMIAGTVVLFVTESSDLAILKSISAMRVAGVSFPLFL